MFGIRYSLTPRGSGGDRDKPSISNFRFRPCLCHLEWQPACTQRNIIIWQYPNKVQSGGWGPAGQQVRSLFTPRDARADFILDPCRSAHDGRLSNQSNYTRGHAHGPSASLPHAPVLVQAPAHEARANGRAGRGLGGTPQERLSCSTAGQGDTGVDQQTLPPSVASSSNLCARTSEGRRWLHACSTCYDCSARAMPTPVHVCIAVRVCLCK